MKMPRNFDKFVKKLQKEIIQKDIEDHNKRIVDLFYNPQNWGKPSTEEITVFDEKEGINRTFFGLYLKIEDKTIKKANFITDGCGVMVATGSQLTLLLEGKTIENVENLKADNLIDALNGIPSDEYHCIELAISTLNNVIDKYKDSREI
jgi:nitrogen fixation NifU-like protein